ncbi:MAG: acylphosphatase [Anaerolineaceae bacterium]
MSTTPETKELRLHATIFGHVQGVGFRYFVLDQAQQLGLTGWVRNLPAGTVEILADGAKADLETLLSRVQQGPTGARVSDVRFDWFELTGEFTSFRVSSY